MSGFLCPENDFYEKNLSLLKTIEKKGQIKIKYDIEKLDIPAGAQIIPTKTGSFTLKLKKGKSGEILLHSAYDPLKEAKNFIEGASLEETFYLIVMGFGLGYHIRYVLENLPWIRLIFVIEPSPSLFKLALCCQDMTSIFSSSKFKLVVDDDPSRIKKEILPLAETFLTGKTSLICLTPYFYIYKDKIDKIRKSVQDAIHWSITNLTTNIARGGVFQRNILYNLPEVIKNPGVKNLFDKFKGKPAICIAAGPSLGKNVALLHEVKNKALTICVDAALKTLLDRGIKPDFVVSIDYGVGARNLFNGLIDKTADLCLVADPEVYPRVLSDFRGKKFIVNIRKPLTRWLENFIGDKGLLEKGASVAHAAFSFARALGAEPVILIGQDLCFPGGFTHAEGALPRRKIAIGTDKKTGKRYLLQMAENGKWIARDLVMVKDIFGNSVPTTPDMYSYLVYFERLIQLSGIKCIDATEGGVKIEGTEIMTLKEAIERYCKEEFEIKKVIEKASQEKAVMDLKKLKEEMKKVVLKLKEMNFQASQGEEVIDALIGGIKRGSLSYQRLKHLAAESNKIEEKIRSEESYIRSFLEEEMSSHLYLAARKTNLRWDKFSKRKKLLNQIEKVGLFYGGVKKATFKLIKDFEYSLFSLNSLIPTE